MDKIYIEDSDDASEGGMSSVATCAACGYQLKQPDDEGEKDIKEQQVDETVTFVNFKK
ncbi:MAG: hypothetical protein MI867_04700 [Pseudomonadales bacterium]|nr:hypothetical protein [Pseudomonadales bacterium]